MSIFRSLSEVPRDFGPCALTIGNFDGVHHGHRRILRRIRQIADANGWDACVLTFDPHPAQLVAPERAPRLMTTPAKRAELMREEGIRNVLILPFVDDVAQLSPEEFVRQIVAGRLDARVVCVGSNFRFGYRQAGDVGVLAELGRRFGFQTEIIPAVTCRGRVISSSGIRQLVREGRVALAARFLERPFALEGEVVRGRGVGSKVTVPTLNLATDAEIIPADGVYLTRTSDRQDARTWNSITNVGYRPTFTDGGGRTIETYLLGTLEGETPRRIAVEFLCRLRGERAFPDPASLKAQIVWDAGVAQRYFRRSALASAEQPRAKA